MSTVFHGHINNPAVAYSLTGPFNSYHASEDGSYNGGGGQRRVAPTQYANDTPYLPPRDSRPSYGRTAPDVYGQQYAPQDSHYAGHAATSPPPPYQAHPIPAPQHTMYQHTVAQRAIAPAPPVPTSYPPDAFHQPLPPYAMQQAVAFNTSPPSQFGPDPGPFIRKKLNLPPNAPISLWNLPDYAPGVRPSVPLPLLCQVAIYSSERKRLTLQEICRAIEERYPFFTTASGAWKRSIRHALSLQLVFRHLERPVQEPGKGGYWTLDYSAGDGYKRERKRRGGPEEGEGDSDDGAGTDAESEGGFPLQHVYPQHQQHPSYAPPPHHPLQIDTARRNKQESSPSPTPSPGSASHSSHSSEGLPMSMSSHAHVPQRRGTMPSYHASYPSSQGVYGHPGGQRPLTQTPMEFQQGSGRAPAQGQVPYTHGHDPRMLREHSSAPGSQFTSEGDSKIWFRGGPGS
ncbi:Winged helix DNA-binding domain-containing protein [Mycena kentingensis (nom. inval.)]|nr:Winged helix DNA-binding domain-containing protein [Mycena kentingensis (nom. inval.)]